MEIGLWNSFRRPKLQRERSYIKVNAEVSIPVWLSTLYKQHKIAVKDPLWGNVELFVCFRVSLLFSSFSLNCHRCAHSSFTMLQLTREELSQMAFMSYIVKCVFFSPQIRVMSSSSRMLVCALALALYMVEVASAETLCGGELVDALQFVCEDRGFYFSRWTHSYYWLM